MTSIRVTALLSGFTGLLLGGSGIAILAVLVVTPLVAVAAWLSSDERRTFTNASFDL
jgi:hypothetical protein